MPIGGPVGGVGREGAKTCAGMLTKMLRRIGADTSNSDNRAVALEALHDAVDMFNLSRDWKDRQLTHSITLIADTATYDLPARFRKPVGRAWLQDTDGNRSQSVQLLTNEQFLGQVSDEDVASADPDIATIYNRVDQGQVEVWPPPSSTSITIYPVLEIPYYGEIPKCNDSGSETLGVSGALQYAIFAQALVFLNDELGDETKAERFEMRAAIAWRMAIGYDSQMRLNMGNLRGIN